LCLSEPVPRRSLPRIAGLPHRLRPGLPLGISGPTHTRARAPPIARRGDRHRRGPGPPYARRHPQCRAQRPSRRPAGPGRGAGPRNPWVCVSKAAFAKGPGWMQGTESTRASRALSLLKWSADQGGDRPPVPVDERAARAHGVGAVCAAASREPWSSAIHAMIATAPLAKLA
jgi:hypothetical protein